MTKTFPRHRCYEFTADDIAAIIASPLPSKTIAKQYGVDRKRILRVRSGHPRPRPAPVDPVAKREAKLLYFRERQRAKYRERWLRDTKRPEGWVPLRKTSALPPPHVIEEAVRAMAAPRTLGMVYCGEPLPGRSALDRMYPQPPSTPFDTGSGAQEAER